MTQSPASVVDSGHSLNINFEKEDIRIENTEVATLQSDDGNACDHEITTGRHRDSNAQIIPLEGASFFNSGVEARASTLRERRRTCTLDGLGGSQRKTIDSSNSNQPRGSKTDHGPKNWSCSLMEHKVKLRATGDEGEVCAVIDKGWIQVRLASGRKVKTRPGLVEALEVPSDEAAATIATFASKTKSLSGSSGASALELHEVSRRSAAPATRKRRSISDEDSTGTERYTQGAEKMRRQRERIFGDDTADEGSSGEAGVHFEEKFNECSNQDQFYRSRDESEFHRNGGSADDQFLEHKSEDGDDEESGRGLIAESYKLLQVCTLIIQNRYFLITISFDFIRSS